MDCVLAIILRALAMLTHFSLYNCITRWEHYYYFHFQAIYPQICTAKVVILGFEHRKSASAVHALMPFATSLCFWPALTLVVCSLLVEFRILSSCLCTFTNKNS